jgi:hypothetical protein
MQVGRGRFGTIYSLDPLALGARGVHRLQQNLKRRWPVRLRFSNRTFSPPAAATTRSAGTFAWSAFRHGALPFDFPLILNRLTAV